MKTRQYEAMDTLVQAVGRPEVRPSFIRRGLAASAIFFSVGAGAHHYSDQQAAGITPAASTLAVNRNDEKNSSFVASKTDGVIEQRNEMRRASNILQDNDVVRSVAAYSAEALTGQITIEQEVAGGSGIVSQRASSLDGRIEHEGERCANNQEMSPEVMVDTMLYPGGVGVMTFRIGEMACKTALKNTNSVTLSVEMKHPGRANFNLGEALTQIREDPSSVAVASLQVKSADQQAYISNTQMGTGRKGDTVSIKNNTGEIIESRSYQEAEQVAQKANHLARDVLRDTE